MILLALLIEPHFEGRNVNATFFEIYFTDPFLAYVYIFSIPFFISLYQVIQILRHAQEGRKFSDKIVEKLRIIKYCMFTTAIAIVAADIYLVTFANKVDDPAGAVMLGIIATFISLVIATTAWIFENKLTK